MIQTSAIVPSLMMGERMVETGEHAPPARLHPVSRPPGDSSSLPKFSGFRNESCRPPTETAEFAAIAAATGRLLDESGAPEKRFHGGPAPQARTGARTRANPASSAKATTTGGKTSQVTVSHPPAFKRRPDEKDATATEPKTRKSF